MNSKLYTNAQNICFNILIIYNKNHKQVLFMSSLIVAIIVGLSITTTYALIPIISYLFEVLTTINDTSIPAVTNIPITTMTTIPN